MSEFKYLGSLMSEDGCCEKEIHSRIEDIHGKMCAATIHRGSPLGLELTSTNSGQITHLNKNQM